MTGNTDLEQKLARVERLLAELQSLPSYADKLSVVEGLSETRTFLASSPHAVAALTGLQEQLRMRDAYLLLVLPALGQPHVLAAALRSDRGPTALLDVLAQVESVYDVLGGLVGYQAQCLRLLRGGGREDGPAGGRAPGSDAAPPPDYSVPAGLRLNSGTPSGALVARRAALSGVRAAPRVAEIWPVGGCADRLGLRCPESGEDLPAALLCYAGRPLLETLVRDTAAREYLHWRVYGGHARPTTPIVMMTSSAKDNHRRIVELCESREWWGRDKDSFRFVCQPEVPVLEASTGEWLVPGATPDGRPLMKPGGHGVLWKLLLDAGVYTWLRSTRRSAAVLRQISNPMAATDTTMLALIGRGQDGAKAFGFASCERRPGAAEGINVLARVPGTGGVAVTNIEYTEFARLGIPEELCRSGSGHSAFPANANILYADLPAVEAALHQGVLQSDAATLLPGLTFNAGKTLTYVDGRGRAVTARAGRLECTMQNIAERFASEPGARIGGADDGLATFLVTNSRRKVTSSAKRAAKPGSSEIQQTPPGSFYDLQLNAEQLLKEYCDFDLPEVRAVETYLREGPDFIFLFHPALGPVWSVIGQKLRGGRLGSKSELQLEVAEADIENLDVEGSLLIVAEDVMGPGGGPRRKTPAPPQHGWLFTSDALNTPRGEQLAAGNGRRHQTFGDACGRVRLRNVTVRNAGVDWDEPSNCYWQHRVRRSAACRVVLRGASEFEAQDVVIRGDETFEVPDGFRMLLVPDPASRRGWAALLQPLDPARGPTWNWEYRECQVATAIELRIRQRAWPTGPVLRVSPGSAVDWHADASHVCSAL